ncbi:MAG: hypothetical protein ACKOOG_05280 [Actinomycetota bacterium]
MAGQQRRVVAAILGAILVSGLVACSSDDGERGERRRRTTTTTRRPAGATSTTLTPAAVGATGTTSTGTRRRAAATALGVDASTAQRCDVLDPARCLLPFPNDHFTVSDRSSATGRRVRFDAASMPANAKGRRVDPTEWNRNDGFSPGAMIQTLVPGLDLARTAAAPITDIGRSLRADAPIVLLDATTGARWPHWAELDAQADPAEGALLVIRPARNLVEGHRYIVALRNLRTASGAAIPAQRGFTLYRDRIATGDARLEARRAHLDSVMNQAGAAGVARDSSLFLAWDFTVASTRNITGRMLHIRDDAFARIGSGAPAFTVTSVTDGVDSRIFRRVEGTYEVPMYLTGGGAPGSVFAYAPGSGPDANPVHTGTFTASFICNIPRVAMPDATTLGSPAKGMTYGHGLLGSRSEVNAGNVRTMADEHGFVPCATDWTGFAQADIGTAVTALEDFSNFPKMADRTQQGFLNTLFLARLVRSPSGFASHPAFRVGADPVLDGTVFYDGNSQGGILGGAVTAVSNEWSRAVLGVPGMNYSTLLQRSVDFDTYSAILAPAYPSELDRMLDFAIVQMLWDRAEANGYAAHMTDDPLPGTIPHRVMLHVAYGDHQVANVTAEVEARTIGARVWQPGLAPGRSPDLVPFWGLAGAPDGWGGSVLVMWDAGTPTPPLGNVPPRPPTYGADPHEFPRRTPAAQLQKARFLDPAGFFSDTCGGPCVAS